MVLEVTLGLLLWQRKPELLPFDVDVWINFGSSSVFHSFTSLYTPPGRPERADSVQIALKRSARPAIRSRFRTATAPAWNQHPIAGYAAVLRDPVQLHAMSNHQN